MNIRNSLFLAAFSLLACAATPVGTDVPKNIIKNRNCVMVSGTPEEVYQTIDASMLINAIANKDIFVPKNEDKCACLPVFFTTIENSIYLKDDSRELVGVYFSNSNTGERFIEIDNTLTPRIKNKVILHEMLHSIGMYHNIKEADSIMQPALMFVLPEINTVTKNDAIRIKYLANTLNLEKFISCDTFYNKYKVQEK